MGSTLDEQIKAEESKFYERYRLNEINKYRNVTFIGAVKNFVSIILLNDDGKDNDNVYKLEQFWDSFLRNNTSIITSIHSVNILLLILTVGFLNELKPVNSSILWNCLVWMIVSVACLLFILWYKSNSSESILHQRRKKSLKMWRDVGYFVLYMRALKLAGKVMATITQDVIKSDIGDEESLLKNLVLSVAIDFVQLVVFSTVPFPTPINFYITFLELVAQILKIWLSKRYLVNEVLGAYLYACCLLTSLNLHALIIMSVLIVESTEKATYTNLKAFQLKSSDKNRLINLICSDTKSIVKDLAKAVENISNHCIDADIENNVRHVARSIVLESEKVNVVTDNLLLLTRIGDGKWGYKESAVNVRELVVKAQNDSSFNNLKVKFKINIMTNIERDVIADSDIISILLRSTLFYWYHKTRSKYSNNYKYNNAYELIELEMTCKLSTTKQKHMLVFQISKKEIITTSDDVRTTSIKTRLKTGKKVIVKTDVAESNLAVLMNLASMNNGYCEIKDDTGEDYIEFGIFCTGQLSSSSSLPTPQPSMPLMPLLSQSELLNDNMDNFYAGLDDAELNKSQMDGMSAISNQIRKSEMMKGLKSLVIAADFIKLQKIVKLLEGVGIDEGNITSSKSLRNSLSLSNSKHADVRLACDIVFVDSKENCNYLASLGTYFGLVVLIADLSDEEATSYETKRMYHYHLPLYCLDIEVVNFKEWLGERNFGYKEAVSSRLDSHKSLTSRVIGFFKRSSKAGVMIEDGIQSYERTNDVNVTDYNIYKHNSYNSSVKTINAHNKFEYKTLWGLTVLTFSEAIEETYRRVKILNPTDSFIHPNTSLQWTAIFYVYHALTIQSLTAYYLPAVPFRLYRAIFFFVALPFVYLKDNFFNLLNRRFGVSATAYAFVWGFVLTTCWTVLPVLTYFMVVRRGKALFTDPLKLQREDPVPIDTFYAKSYNGYAGIEYIGHIFISCIYLIGTIGFCLYLHWPFNVLLPFFSLLNLCLFVGSLMYELLLVDLVEIAYVYTIASILLTFGLLIVMSILHFEWMNRSNYQILRKVMDCNDFIYDSYKFCHNDLVKPMTKINESHQYMLSLLQSLVLKKKIALTPALKNNIDSFNMQNILIDLLLVDLNSKKSLSNDYKESLSNSDGTYADIVPIASNEETNNEYKDESKKYDTEKFDALDCDVVYLKSEIQEICSVVNAFYNKDNFALKIFFDIDDSLSIIRANKKIIRILVTNAILNSVAILKQDMHIDDTSRTSWHEIVLNIEPRRSLNDNMRFTELRWMNIAVRDSRSSQASGSSTSLLNYVQYRSREVMEMLSKFDTEMELAGNKAKSICLPYRLHPCHHQMLGIVSKAKKIKSKVTGVEGLFDRYRQWPKGKSVSSRPFSILIVQYIPDDTNMLLLGLLRSRGWFVELVSSIRVIEFNPNNLKCDCIIIDYSRYDQVKRNSVNLLDEISIIKLFGYQGVLVGVFDNFNGTGPDEIYYKKCLDLIITHPVIDPVIDSIAVAIKSHKLRLLLSFFSATITKHKYSMKKT